MRRKRDAWNRGLGGDVDPTLVAFVARFEVYRARRVGLVGFWENAEVVFGGGRADGSAGAVDTEFGFDAGLGGPFDEAEDFGAMLLFGSRRSCCLGSVVGVRVDCFVNLFVGSVEGKLVCIKIFGMLWGG